MNSEKAKEYLVKAKMGSFLEYKYENIKFTGQVIEEWNGVRIRFKIIESSIKNPQSSYAIGKTLKFMEDDNFVRFWKEIKLGTEHSPVQTKTSQFQ